MPTAWETPTASPPSATWRASSPSAASPSSAREKLGEDRIAPQLKAAFRGIWIANEAFDKAAVEAVIAAGEADAVAFGKAFIANPDLVRRLAFNAPLNRWNSETFYSPGPQGYTDYPDVA
jgi:2,4-dienoyl-CoA reductase-like NADH-dependent reductase (Old Yellow Enzyme family)